MVATPYMAAETKLKTYRVLELETNYQRNRVERMYQNILKKAEKKIETP